MSEKHDAIGALSNVSGLSREEVSTIYEQVKENRRRLDSCDRHHFQATGTGIRADFVAFDKNGFSWNAFLAFCTAGPTIAWLRGFVKKAVLNFQKGSG